MPSSQTLSSSSDAITRRPRRRAGKTSQSVPMQIYTIQMSSDVDQIVSTQSAG